jgi:hypothetical protein
MSLASLTRAFADTLHALGQELKCPICLSLMSSPRILACGHTFCGVCLTGWLKTKACCPICKTAAARRGDRKEETVTELLQAFRLATPPSSQGAGLQVPAAHMSAAAFEDACAFTQLPGATQLFDGFKDWEGDEEDDAGDNQDEHNDHHDDDDVVLLEPQKAPVVAAASLPMLTPDLSSPPSLISPPNPTDAIMAAAPAPHVVAHPGASAAVMDIPASIMETACCVCLSLRVKPGDAIIKCLGKPTGAGGSPGCGMTVHLSCYGSTAEATPWEDWLCDSCRGGASQDTLRCELCPCSARHALKLQAKDVCTASIPGRTPPPSRAKGRAGTKEAADNMHVNKTGVLVTDEVPAGGFNGLNPGLPFTDVSLSRARRAGDMDFPQAWRPTLAGTWVHAVCCIWLPEPFTVPAADIIKTLQQTLNVFGSAGMREGGSNSGRKRRREGDEDITDDPMELKPMPLRADHLDSSSIMSQVPVSILQAYAASAGLPLPSSPFPFAISLPLLAVAVAYFRSQKFLPSTLIVANLCAIDRDRYRMYCVVCGLRGGEVGAVVQCCKDECVRGYHPMCALRAGLFMKWSQVVDEAEIHRNEADGMLDVSYTHFCDQHSPSAFDARVAKPALVKGQRKHGSSANPRAVKFASVAVREDDPCPPLPSPPLPAPPATSHFAALDIVPVTAAPTPPSTSSAPPKKKARRSTGRSPGASSSVSRLSITPTSAHKSPLEPAGVFVPNALPSPSCTTIVDTVDCGKSEMQACLDAGKGVVDLAFCPTALDAAIAVRVAVLRDPSISARALFPTHVVTPASNLLVPWEELVERSLTSTIVAWRQHDETLVLDEADDPMIESGGAPSVLHPGFGSPAGKKKGEDLTLTLPLARRCSHRYLCALLAGCHLVRPEWVVACKKGGYPVHELPYAIVGHKGETGIRPHMFFGPSPLTTLGHILDSVPANSSIDHSGAASSGEKTSVSKEISTRRRQALVTAVCASAAPARALRMRRLAEGSTTNGSGQGRLFRCVTFILWGEFENPPKLVTRMEILELAAIGGAACVWPMPPSGRTLDLHHVHEYPEWEGMVTHALTHAPTSDFPPIIVVCDEPHFTLPSCISSLPLGTVSMVTPAFILHCAATACLLDPFQDEYAHPAAKGILKPSVPKQ